MSPADTRQVLAAAVSTVDAVDAQPYFVQDVSAGRAHIRRGVTDVGRFGTGDTWDVVVMLPQDIATAEQWRDDNQPDVIAALEAVDGFTVTAVTPQQISIPGAGVLPCLFFTGTREE